MKKYLLLSILACLSLSIFAQNTPENSWKDLSFLDGQSQINFTVDFSRAIILDMDVEEFIAQEPDWDEGLAEMRAKFIQAFNEKSPVKAVTGEDTDYMLVILPLKVTEKGSHVQGFFRIADQSGKEVFTHRFDNEAGIFGSALNLMGDAFEDLGEELGKAFKKNVD